MKDTFTYRSGIAKLKLLAVLAALGIGYAAIPAVAASAASASNDNADRHLTTHGEASQVAPSGRVPTLTDDVGQPAGGAERQLPLGVGLLALGLLGLGYGITAQRRTRGGSGPRATRPASQT